MLSGFVGARRFRGLHFGGFGFVGVQSTCDDEQATCSLAEAQKFDQRAVAAAACAKAVRQEYGSGLELFAVSRMFARIKRASHLVVCTAVASIAT